LQVSPTHTTAVPPPPLPTGRVTRSRSSQFAVFFAAIAWYFCAISLARSASSGLAVRFDLIDAQSLIEAICLLFLTIVGFAFLRILERRRAPLGMTIGLPRRVTSRAEWATGAAIGWGIAVAAVLPMVFARALNVRFWTAPRAYELLALNLVTLALFALTAMLAYAGYPFQRLIEAVGPTRATILMALFAGVLRMIEQNSPVANPGTAIFVAVVGSLLISIAWLRTHGLWLSWGLTFAWNASLAMLFGLPIQGFTGYASVIDTRSHGPLWLTGGSYGPAGGLLAAIFFLAAIPILVLVTSDYAWDYTRPPLIPAGYDVTIPPPAAHVAMEQAALEAQPVNPASLVQILPATRNTPPE
jgi:uncharacterized protein